MEGSQIQYCLIIIIDLQKYKNISLFSHPKATLSPLDQSEIRVTVDWDCNFTLEEDIESRTRITFIFAQLGW